MTWTHQPRPSGADVELVETVNETDAAQWDSHGILKPNLVLINGTPVWLATDSPVGISDVGSHTRNEPPTVTVTMLVRNLEMRRQIVSDTNQPSEDRR